MTQLPVPKKPRLGYYLATGFVNYGEYAIVFEMVSYFWEFFSHIFYYLMVEGACSKAVNDFWNVLNNLMVSWIVHI